MGLTRPVAEESDPDQAPALLGRIFTKRTLLSIVAALVIVALAVWRAPINWGGAWAQIRHANLLFYALALLVYYLSFVARGARWQVLLANAGEVRRTRRLAPVVLASFFVNCVVPAKLGDVYRAYLGGVRERIPGSKAFGTVVSERLLDLCVLMALLLVSGGYVFHKRSSAALVPYVIFGSLLCMVGIGVILAMRAGRGTRLLRLLPEGIFHRYESFRFGAVTSLRRWPTLLGLTFSVWICESGRLGLVIAALGYSGQVGISQFVLVALVAALLTTIPFTPGGLGLVQAGVVGALVVVTDVGVTRATAIALLDGSISYASLLVFGFIAFAAVNVRSRVTETASARGERREHDAGVTPPGAAAAERLG